MAAREDILIEKLKTLPVELLTEVEDFVDFVQAKAADRSDRTSFSQASDAVFTKLWDNPLDADYDKL